MPIDPEMRDLGCVGEGVRPAHRGDRRRFPGVLGAQAGDSPLIAEVLAATDALAEAVGRRPRILVAKMGRVMKTGAEWMVRQRPDDGVAPDAG